MMRGILNKCFLLPFSGCEAKCARPSAAHHRVPPGGGQPQVFSYILDPGVAARHVLQHYEQQGLVEAFDFRMSRRLPDAVDLADPEKCK